jgi:hypothetical protein
MFLQINDLHHERAKKNRSALSAAIDDVGQKTGAAKTKARHAVHVQSFLLSD